MNHRYLYFLCLSFIHIFSSESLQNDQSMPTRKIMGNSQKDNFNPEATLTPFIQVNGTSGSSVYGFGYRLNPGASIPAGDNIPLTNLVNSNNTTLDNGGIKVTEAGTYLVQFMVYSFRSTNVLPSAVTIAVNGTAIAQHFNQSFVFTDATAIFYPVEGTVLIQVPTNNSTIHLQAANTTLIVANNGDASAFLVTMTVLKIA